MAALAPDGSQSPIFRHSCKPAGDIPLAAFKGYFDESGKENDPQFADSAVSVAGWITIVDSWRDIEEPWVSVLQPTAMLRSKEWPSFCMKLWKDLIRLEDRRDGKTWHQIIRIFTA